MMTRSMRVWRVASVVVVIAAILAGEWLWLNAARDGQDDNAIPAITLQASGPGGPFSLVDHFGRPVTLESFQGKYLVMVFGYTSCPDVCPTTLGKLAAALALLGERARDVQPLFVTVDPERDSPEVLAEFVAAFHSRLIGLTGSLAQIERVTQDYRVYVARPETGGDYLVDHSAYIYVIGPDGRMLSYLKDDTTPDAMAGTIERLMSQETSAGGSWN